MELTIEDKEVYGIVKNINKRTKMYTIQGKENIYRAHKTLLQKSSNQVKKDEFITFTKGDIVTFNYNNKKFRGIIKRVNKITIGVLTNEGSFKIAPHKLDKIKLSKDEFNDLIKTLEEKTINLKKKKIADKNKSENFNIEKLSSERVIVIGSGINNLSNALNRKDEEQINVYANEIMEKLTEYYKLPSITVYTKGKRSVCKNREIRGVHRLRGKGTEKERASISVYSKTSNNRSFVSAKTFLLTLIHEFMHHYDYFLLKIENNVHTKGFERRIETLYDQLIIFLS